MGVKDYINALKIGIPPPPVRKRSKSAKKAQKKAASRKVIEIDEGTSAEEGEASESINNNSANEATITSGAVSQVETPKSAVTDISSPDDAESSGTLDEDNTLTAVIEVEEATDQYNFL